MIYNLDTLLPEEKSELLLLYNLWESCKHNKDWNQADKLRQQLNLWDTNIVNDKLWHPAFEHNLNRQRRAFKRMKRYNVSVNPWTLNDL